MISDGILDELAGVSVPRTADTLWQEKDTRVHRSGKGEQWLPQGIEDSYSGKALVHSSSATQSSSRRPDSYMEEQPDAAV